MNWLTDEVMFYGGMIVFVCSLVLGIIYCIISYIKKIHLNMQLDEEYGKKICSSKGIKK